ncbi:hypothetical protein BLA24_20365 [Streptomyces cinnamoneus]|uniref:Uncharacterized protein n=1 Tax=Streptomyces cinnamoneus TaxID=53446 RepID=A0A2G1XFF7_STRCJ|nr:acyl-CoA carboxylase epsilon subunit [Streptomyces cinnamoneus]PHQ49974.1 hypothetical protein BLA24_20365 [Streptomyces cinnamoneus]PPT13249.1 acetyl-CoA carboxylase biotin carboxyl carrier protein subunit [Streptomyces cinnamoneus]
MSAVAHRGREPAESVLRVVRGDPDAAQLAAATVALLAALRGRAGGDGAGDGRRRPARWRPPVAYEPPGAWGSGMGRQYGGSLRGII